MPETRAPAGQLAWSDRMAPAAHAAAAWWARAAVDPGHGFGDSTPGANVRRIDGREASPSEAALKNFQGLLAEYINNDLTRAEGPVIVGTDDSSDVTLLACLQEAGIEACAGAFPRGTRMYVTQRSVTVSQAQGSGRSMAGVWVQG